MIMIQFDIQGENVSKNMFKSIWECDLWCVLKQHHQERPGHPWGRAFALFKLLETAEV